MTGYELDIGTLKKRLADPEDRSTQDLDDLPYAVTVADRFGREWWPTGWAQRWVTATGARSIGLAASQLAERNGPIGLSAAAAAAAELIAREADLRSVRIPWHITDQGTWKREEAWRQQDSARSYMPPRTTTTLTGVAPNTSTTPIRAEGGSRDERIGG